MKKLLPLLLLPITAAAQWQQTGGYTGIRPNTTVASSSYVTLYEGAIDNRGRAYCQELKAAPNTTLLGNGNWLVSENLLANGFNPGNLVFIMRGDSAGKILATNDALYRLWLEKPAGPNEVVELLAPLTLANQLRFVNPRNKLKINDFDLNLQPNATIAGADSSNYVLTNGLGFLVKQGHGGPAFVFPVGADGQTYNPMLIRNTGVADDIGVRCLPDALQNGGKGNPFPDNAVAASWEIKEALPGGSLLDLRATWYLPDELPNFKRKRCALRWHNGFVWDNTPFGQATGNNPYNRLRQAMPNVGYFAVLDFTLPFTDLDDREISGEAILNISPNPAGEAVQLNFSGMEPSESLDIQVFNEDGKLIRSENFSGEGIFEMQVEDLPHGNYFVSVFGEKTRLFGRFVKI